jgi:hypothetical protein
MSGEVDFIVAAESDADAILRDPIAVERWGGVTWKWLDHTRLYVLYGLLDGRFTDYAGFCQECSRVGQMSPHNEEVVRTLLAEFEPGELHDRAFLHCFPRRFVELLAQLEPESIAEVSARWHQSPDMRSWRREWVVQVLGELRMLAVQAITSGATLFLRIGALD